ncbi:glycosyltransferase family 9 protein [Candidatus Poribacteria bacterium]|nr:glycosyltransferase family 9 protein [Candidatus Poribacteria bacterium]
MGPALRALRLAHPSAHIALQVRPLVQALMERHPHVDEVIPWEKGPGARQGILGVARDLRRRSFDAAIVWHPTSVSSAVTTWLARIPVRVGSRISGRGLFLTRGCRAPTGHETTRYLRPLGLLGISPDTLTNTNTYFWHGDADRAFAVEFLTDHELTGPTVGMHLATTWTTKRWEPARFAAVARSLVESGARVLITGALSDEPLRDAFMHEARGVDIVDAVGRFDLFELAALIERCDAYVTADSGPMHIAAAVGTPVVALFGLTDPARHGPVGEGHTVAEASLPCRPCYRRSCRIRDRNLCMGSIEPDDVASRARRAIAADGGRLD